MPRLNIDVVKKGRRGHAAIKLTAGPRRSFDEVEGVENMRATFPRVGTECKDRCFGEGAGAAAPQSGHL